MEESFLESLVVEGKNVGNDQPFRLLVLVLVCAEEFRRRLARAFC